jgi:hypothetical protein
MTQFSECTCDKPGYCNLYGRIMEANPPNWQWCQKTNAQERQKFHQLLSKAPPKAKNIHQLIATKDLHKQAVKILGFIRQENINVIVGVPRSGMIVASLLSVYANLPLYSISDNNLIKLNAYSPYGGHRMSKLNTVCDNFLFVDDTAYAGTESRRLRNIFGKDIKIAVAYSATRALPDVDYAANILEPPHFLEWHFFNSPLVSNSIFDIDGILCPNVPIDAAKQEDSYVNWISNVEPMTSRIPSTFKISKIVTGRLDTYRSITEKWLETYGVNYDDLIMFPADKKKERDEDHFNVVGLFKGEIYAGSRESHFVESELSEATIIGKYTNKIVIYP